ncbi:hypothetical protein V6N13_037081 [Hibiscus sabdariffa]
MVGRRARKSMSGAADDSTTKFPISGKVPLEWLMHRLASPNPGHAQSVGVFVTPGRPTTRGFGLVDARSCWLCATCLDNVTPNTSSPCVAKVQFGGVSRPSNVRASARSMSQWVLLLRQPALPCPPFVALDFCHGPRAHARGCRHPGCPRSHSHDLGLVKPIEAGPTLGEC